MSALLGFVLAIVIVAVATLLGQALFTFVWRRRG
jgi:hypothetical protein